MYIPRLIHEYSHNLLFGIARNEPLLLNDPDERYLSPLRQELRPLDGIYHAAFVSAREALAIRMILTRLSYTDDFSSQLSVLKEYCEQTLLDSEQSFKECVSVVRQHGKLTKIGQTVLQDTELTMNLTL